MIKADEHVVIVESSRQLVAEKFSTRLLDYEAELKFIDKIRDYPPLQRLAASNVMMKAQQ